MTGKCTLTGDLGLTDSARLHVSNSSSFTVAGSIRLTGMASLKVTGSTFIIPNTRVYQYRITAYNSASLEITDSELVTTSGTIQSSVPMDYSGHENSSFTITNSHLDSAKSWLLCQTVHSATLTTSEANYPNEVYLHHTSTVNIGPGANHVVWLDFPRDMTGVFKNVPNTLRNSFFSFGRTTTAPSSTNAGYQLNINGGTANLSVRSYPGSSVTIENPPGPVTDYAPFAIGLYLSSEDGGSTLPRLEGERADGAGTSLSLSTTNRTLNLNNARLSRFPWHIYPDGLGSPVTINDSLINEVAALSQGPISPLKTTVIVNDAIFQFSLIAALSPETEVAVNTSEIHSQTILTHNNAVTTIKDSTIYGALIQAMSTSRIYLLNNLLTTNPPYIPDVENGHNPLVAANAPVRYITSEMGAIIGLGIDKSLPVFQAGGGGVNVSGDGFIKGAEAAGLTSCTFELGYENTDGTGYLSKGVVTPISNRWTKSVSFGVAGAYKMVLRLTCPSPTGVISVKRPFTVAASTLTVSPTTVSAGWLIAATWANIISPTAADWLGLYATSDAANSSPRAWRYTTGTATGSLPFTIPQSIPSGMTCELRLFSNNGSSRLATSNSFTIRTTTLSVSPTTVLTGGSVTATWNNITNPTATDRLALYASPNGSAIAWRYTNGLAGGSLPFNIPQGAAPGTTYQLRLWSNDTPLATSNSFTILTTTLTVSPTTITAGGTVTATWANIANPSATDWLALYGSSGAANSPPLAWRYTNGLASSSLPFNIPVSTAPGATYELRLWSNNGYTRLATSNSFTVQVATLTANPTIINAGGTVTATWANIGSPTATDWLALYNSSGAPNSPPVAWRYTNGLASSSLPFSIPQGAVPGATYELRLWSNNGYTRLATSNSFTIAAATLTVSPTTIPAGGTVTATWSNIANPSATDWLALYASSGAPNSPPIAWRYTNGLASGNLPFDIPESAAPGATYELRLWGNNIYIRLATSNTFTVQ